MALAAAGAAAQGATAYVTLEPCSHHGRTPPCADALIEAGVARVLVAVQDPNPLVAGQGIEKLRAAGIVVEFGLMEAAARELNIGFFARMTRGLPWVRSKIAASLDGRTALNNGESKWITGTAARQCCTRSEEHTSELQSRLHLVCRLLLEKKKKNKRDSQKETEMKYAHAHST